MRRALGLATAAALVVGSTTAFAQQSQQVTAELRDANGQAVGTTTLMPMGEGVHVRAQVRNLPPGPHGIHFHAVGRCDAPDFMSAGPHFNPTNKLHGLENPDGPHLGDMPNLEVGADGTATFDFMDMMVSLGSGEGNLLDADGTSLVIHANADDQVTDPSGNSGGRIACAVVTQAAAAAAPAAQPSPAAKPAGAPAATPAPAAKPGGAPAQAGAPAAQPSPAAKPGGAPAQAPAAAPAQAPRPAASPMPAGLPRTGAVAGVAEAALPAALAGLAALGLGVTLRRRR